MKKILFNLSLILAALVLTHCGPNGQTTDAGTPPATSNNQPPPAPPTPAEKACPPVGKVGFKTVPYKANSENLNIAVWYPTEANESSYTYNDKISGSVALDSAPIQCEKKFPTVVFSHGDGGCGIQSAFITEYLARKGYIVIAPDSKDATCSSTGGAHTANNSDVPEFKNFSLWNDQSAKYRKEDLQSAMDVIFSDSDFSKAIDFKKIGAMGHSLGGYTIFGMIGGWNSWYDSRISAAMLLSPFIQAYLESKRAAMATTPLMYQGGTKDLGITPWVNGQKGDAYNQAVTQKVYTEFKDAGHFFWTNSLCTQEGASTVQDCLKVSMASEISNYVVDFFEYFLKGSGGDVLKKASPSVVDFRKSF